ncbi:hypothetical protein M2145_002667 [Lachnospiraceae bacterium PF1-21]
MDIKTIGTILLVAFILGGLIFMKVRSKKK